MSMTKEQLATLLAEHHACREAVTWTKGKSFSEAWSSCTRPDWLLWLAGRMANEKGWWTRQQVVLAACACAESVLYIFEGRYPEDKRPRKAIETARLWAEGKATLEEVKNAAASADAAAYASAAASADAAASAYASADADAAAYASAAAAYASAAAAYASAAAAAAASADAAFRGTLTRKRKELADLVRKELPFELDKEVRRAKRSTTE